MPENKRILDLDEALSRVRGKQTIFKRMLTLFLNSEEFSAFESALAAQDYDRAADVAHAIKGMTGNLSMNALFESSTELMQQLRSGPPDQQLLETYREALVQTRQAVNEVMATMPDA